VSFGTGVAFFGAVSTPDALGSSGPWVGVCGLPCPPGYKASSVPAGLGREVAGGVLAPVFPFVIVGSDGAAES